MWIDVANDSPQEGQVLRAQVCVIGADATGLTVTWELAKAGSSVITLKGGGLKESKRSQSIYRGQNQGQEYFSLHKAQKRYLGGSTNCWTGLYAGL